MTINDIKNDLKEVRYYYNRIKDFDKAEKQIGANSFIEKINRYNEAARDAPPRLYDTYNGLYVNNLTQEDFAFEIGYTPVHVSRMNKELIFFLQKKLEGCERDENGRLYDREKEEP